MIGGRAPTKSTFAVAFTNTGKITGLKVNVLLELGWLKDFFLVTLFSMHASLKKYDYGALDLKYTFCKTNHVPKTAVRAPAVTQMNAIADVIVDHVAAYLGTSGNKVREANMHSMESLKVFQDVSHVGNEDGYTLPAMWNQLKTQARVGEREREVESFNKQHRWLKRGLAMVPVIYQVTGSGNTSIVSIFQDGSVVAEVGGVEMGQGLHTKVRQTIAYAFSSLCSKEEVSKILKNVRILPLDSLHLPNTWIDAGSTTSVAVCATVQQACGVLVQRLLPLREELQISNGKVSWESLCLTAKTRQVDLQSHERWASPEYKYLIHGAAVSEVEVNILTGETRVLATDMIYDAGKSLNHLVDIGQVEGAFVFGLGFFLTEEVVRNSKGKVVSDGTWTYKPPTMDIIPQSFNVELYKSPYHNDHIFSSKAVGEPPLLLSSSVFSAVRMAINAARKDYEDDGGYVDSKAFGFNPPATMDKVKKLCGFDNVEKFLQSTLNSSTTTSA
jgi:xanthine dehydrogenase molybdopterin-binding subunit B